MNVLGISCFYHDAAAALIVDGQLVAASEEERFSRVKHDYEFPQRAIDFCLRKAGITANDLDLVVFYEKPFQKLDRILMSALQTFPRSLGAFREGMLVWLLDKLWVRDTIGERLGIDRKKIAFSAHHLSHAASSYYCSGFDNAAILTVDGVGEWATGTRGVAWDNQIELQQQMSYPHSVGLLYSAFTAFLGFQVNEGEYKVMGMAPYGQPRFVDLIFDKLVTLRDDGSFWLDMDYFAYHYSAYHSFNERFANLLGRPRTPQESNLLDPLYSDIAASIQKATEEILVRQARALHQRTGHENLCMSGGVALNSVANGRVLAESGFRRLFIQPAAGDGGGALGAALYGAYTVLGEKNRFRMKHAYWGEEHSDAQIADWLKANGHQYRELADEDAVCDEAAERLVNGQVVGWMQGRFEWGPRALGNRSILADPRTPIMKDVVNARIKFREPFRPFAPSVLAERVEDFFDLPDAMNVDPARYMLLVLNVHDDMRGQLQAVTHVDGTARIQAVHQAESPRYHKLISRFCDRTGIPVVLNTSFNLRGEPIVNTPAEAFSTFARSEMDALVMGRFIVSRRAVGEGRITKDEDLEQWRHAPTPAPKAEIPDESARARAGFESGGGHNLFGVAAPAAAPPSTAAQAVRTFVARAGMVMLGTLVLLELLLRWFLPMPNLQLGGIYQERDGAVALTPGWSKTVRGSEFNVPIAIDADGFRDDPSPAPAAASPASASPASGFSVPPSEASGATTASAAAGRPMLVMGDSFTFGCWSTPRQRFTGVLQTALGGSTRVISAGSPNWGTDAELTFLRHRLAEVKPYAVVLAFYCGNDYWDNFVGSDAYRVNHGYLEMREPWWSREMDLDCVAASAGVPKPVTTEFGKPPADAPLPGPFTPAKASLGSPWSPPDGHNQTPSRLEPLGAITSWLRHTEVFQAGAGLRLALRTPARFVRPFEPQAWMLRAYPPDLARAVEMTYQYLDGVVAICREQQVPLAIMVIPSTTEVDDGAWAEWVKRNGFEHDADALFDRGKPRRIALDWADSRAVPKLDLAPSLTNRPGMYYKRDMHWTDLGHFVAGERLADLLKTLGWKP